MNLFEVVNPILLTTTTAVIFIVLFLGSIVYFHDKKSILNRIFVLICVTTILNLISVYYSLSVSPLRVLWWIKAALFFAVPHTALFFLFVHTFPDIQLRMKKLYFGLLLLIMILIMAAVASSYVFSGIVIENGIVLPVPGPLILFLGLFMVSFLLGSVVLAVKKYFKTEALERVRWKYVIIGMLLTYSLLIGVIFIGVNVFQQPMSVEFAPVFMLPMIIGMAYAILRHHLLNVRVIATEILTFIILTLSLLEVFTSQGLAQLLLRLGVFAFLLAFGILLIRSVLREVRQREALEVLTAKLESANEQLRKLDKLKSEFLSFASHQVKAPMTAVKGFASLIADGTYGRVSKEIEDAANKIKNSADRMISLVNDLLNLRKIEEGRMEYNFESANLKEVVESVVEELAPLAKSKNLSLSFEAPLPNTPVKIDLEKFRQVVQNLIENAIKYTDSGWVKVSIEPGGSSGRVIMKVADSGVGISSESLTHIFDQFYRGNASRGSKQGFGLGLYIAKQILEDHKGSISVTSGGEGKGSVFTLNLPINTN